MPNDIERGAASDPVEPPRGPSVTSDTAGLDRIDLALFRKVMGSFPTGVTVITTQAGGAPRGMTANAFMSGSLDPPLCVVCVAKRAHMHGYLLQTGRF
ncbi:MAG: flavin reductase family protein, partial [Methylobacteriaceae bacterium]|nr:flavin reductase family protein [Methylobacteriaceae bacterium]